MKGEKRSANGKTAFDETQSIVFKMVLSMYHKLDGTKRHVFLRSITF
jgi:hypothetical protein